MAVDELLRTREAAKLLGVEEGFLERDRAAEGSHLIPYIRIGLRAIRYQRVDLEAYIQKNRVAGSQ